MIEITRELHAEELTEAFGAAVASLLNPGDVIRLEGEMGAGKTTFVRAIGKGLGIPSGTVSSPTFVIVNAYPIPEGSHALSGGRLVHADAYRVKGGIEELHNAGWDRLIDPATGHAVGKAAACVEWPGIIEGAIASDAAVIRIEIMGPESRRFRVILPDSWSNRAGFEWFKDREPIICRVTGKAVSPTSPTFPFADDRARDADLYGWLSGSYFTSRKPEQTDAEENS
jgi:tRNA threonylcarbamoyladenosine biosynthesis protein TsaE